LRYGFLVAGVQDVLPHEYPVPEQKLKVLCCCVNDFESQDSHSSSMAKKKEKKCGS
jgi:hypothetical protein